MKFKQSFRFAQRVIILIEVNLTKRIIEFSMIVVFQAKNIITKRKHELFCSTVRFRAVLYAHMKFPLHFRIMK